MSALNSYLQTKSYIEGWSFSAADKELFQAIPLRPDPETYPFAYRWYIHIASLQGIRFLPISAADVVLKNSNKDIFAHDPARVDEPSESRAEMVARVKQQIKERDNLKR